MPTTTRRCDGFRRRGRRPRFRSVRSPRCCPLYTTELVRGALEERSLRLDQGVWHLRAASRPPQRLNELLSERVAGLARRELRLLELLALAEPLDLEIARRLVGQAAIEALEDRQLVSVALAGRRRELLVGHPLYGEIALDELPASRRASTSSSQHASPTKRPGSAEDFEQCSLVRAHAARWVDSRRRGSPGLHRRADDRSRGCRGATATAHSRVAVGLSRSGPRRPAGGRSKRLAAG